jgi:hypothetical protein
VLHGLIVRVCRTGELSGSWFGKYHRTQRMVHELFSKMPSSLVPAAVEQVANFALGLTTASSAMDTGAFIMTAADVLPAAAIELIMAPVLRILQEDAATLKGTVPRLALPRGCRPITVCLTEGTVQQHRA